MVLSSQGQVRYLQVLANQILNLYLAASAYADLPWIKKLINYIKTLANTKPHVKIIGTLEAQVYMVYQFYPLILQGSVLDIKSLQWLWRVLVFLIMAIGRLEPRKLH